MPWKAACPPVKVHHDALRICRPLDLHVSRMAADCCLPNILMAVSLSFLPASFFGTFTLEFYCVQELLGVKVLPRIPHCNNLVANIILFSITTAAALVLRCISKYFWISVEWIVKKLYNKCSKIGWNENKVP